MFNHAPLSSVLQHCKTAIVNRRFNHNHRPPFSEPLANSSLDSQELAGGGSNSTFEGPMEQHKWRDMIEGP